jgi:CRISPR/Cas system Type II protein with McrA/HNH and RuvC-like nuclease domain
MTRAAAWLVNVGIPKLIPDRLTAPLRGRARDADDRLERSARRLIRRRVERGPTNPDDHTR